MIRTAPPAKDKVFFNNYPVLPGAQSYGFRLQDSPHDSSDSSLEDDLDSITPVRIYVGFFE